MRRYGKRKFGITIFERKENNMLYKSRKEILSDFKAQTDAGKILVGVGAGTGMTAKCSEKADVDMLIIYNSGRYRMAGRGSLSGLLAYGDANQIVVEMGHEVLPIVKKTPVLAGVCGTDPFRVMEIYLKELKEQGFNGVQNFPTVGLIDGVFRQNLEETGMGYGLEVDMVRKAHELDMLTCPYVFDAKQAAAMAQAGADILVAHMGLTTKGSIGAETAKTLDDCVPLIREILEAGRKVNPNVMVICHGGPIADPEDAAYIIRKIPELDGFFGASSIERLASERSMTAQAAAFKAITR
jgi:predicted TIM-barrel enzyme